MCCFEEIVQLFSILKFISVKLFIIFLYYSFNVCSTCNGILCFTSHIVIYIFKFCCRCFILFRCFSKTKLCSTDFLYCFHVFSLIGLFIFIIFFPSLLVYLSFQSLFYRNLDNLFEPFPFLISILFYIFFYQDCFKYICHILIYVSFIFFKFYVYFCFLETCSLRHRLFRS